MAFPVMYFGQQATYLPTSNFRFKGAGKKLKLKDLQWVGRLLSLADFKVL